MTTAVTRFDNIKAITPGIVAEQRAGKWNSWTRVLVYQTEDQKITVIRAEWYERMLAAFLKLFGCDYFAKVFFEGKNATLMTPDEVDGAIKKANELGLKKLEETELSEASKTMMAKWNAAITADPAKNPQVWKDFIDSIPPVAEEYKDCGGYKVIYEITMGDWNASQEDCTKLYMALRGADLGPQGLKMQEMLRKKLEKEQGLIVCLINEKPPIFHSEQSLQALWSVLEAEATGAVYSDTKTALYSAINDYKEFTIDEKTLKISEDLASGVLWQSHTQRAHALLAKLMEFYSNRRTEALKGYLSNVLLNLNQADWDDLNKKYPDPVRHVDYLFTCVRENRVAALLAKQQVEQKAKDAQILETLPTSYEALVGVDPDLNWDMWKQFFDEFNRVLNVDYNTINTLWGAIQTRVQSVEDCQYIYRALMKAQDLKHLDPAAKNYSFCFVFKSVVRQTLEEKGYVVCEVRSRPDKPFVTQFHPLAAIEALQLWYANANTKESPEMAHKLSVIIQDLKQKRGGNQIDYPEFEECLKPLKDLGDLRTQLSKGDGGFKLFDLLDRVLSAYEEKPNEALKAYLKPILSQLTPYYYDRFTKPPLNLEGPVFLLFGESTTNIEQVKSWLKVLYREQIKKFNIQPTFAPGFEHTDPKIRPSPAKEFEGYGLSPSLHAKVEKYLLKILSNLDYLDDLCNSSEGRVALSCMWLQIKDEDALLKAVPLIVNIATQKPRNISVGPLCDILEEFAMDPVRLKNHPNVCDQLLAALFNMRSGVARKNPEWLKTSHWATLQQDKNLPLLQAAYKAKASEYS